MADFAIRAIETEYDGHRFRSRMEARYAVFFRALSVRYEYEPEGFELPDGTRYLPDFWLPDQDCWIEIKGAAPTEEEEHKAQLLAESSGKRVFIFFGEIEIPIEVSGASGNNSALAFFGDGCGDIHYVWCECQHCGKLGIEFDGRAARIKCHCPRIGHPDKGYNANSPRLMAAAKIARCARFEFGENGSPRRGLRGAP